MRALALVILAACGDPSALSPDAAPDGPLVPTDNPAREILDTQLAFDLGGHAGTATLTLAASTEPGATLEVGDLTIDRVTVAGEELDTTRDGARLLLALPASDQPIAVEFAFHYTDHLGFEGANELGYTFLWPYYCGNLFPCHSDPDDGTTFTLDVTGVPEGQTALFPTTIAADAPAYQVAWALDEFDELALGATTAGTEVSIWHRAADLSRAEAGGAHLVAVFDWYERTLGAYRFGSKVGTVSIHWPPGAFGGMEHHPLWHVSSSSLGSEETNAHEAAHGWFGDGIRIACWEDFVLSEGTTTYLAGRALEEVAPEVGASVWNSYAQQLAQIDGADPVWPEGCNAIDILADNLYTNAPYIRGAFFYRALADKLGPEQVDQVLATFYAAHAGKAATMTEMLATIEDVTGYDATACAETWLRSTTKPAPGPCP